MFKNLLKLYTFLEKCIKDDMDQKKLNDKNKNLKQRLKIEEVFEQGKNKLVLKIDAG